MLTVSDISRALADCGDGVEVKADGHTLLTAQIEGTGEGRFLNLVSQPEGVRVTAVPTLPEPAPDQGAPIIAVEPAEPVGMADAGTLEPAVDPNTTEPLL